MYVQSQTTKTCCAQSTFPYMDEALVDEVSLIKAYKNDPHMHVDHVLCLSGKQCRRQH